MLSIDILLGPHDKKCKLIDGLACTTEAAKAYLVGHSTVHSIDCKVHKQQLLLLRHLLLGSLLGRGSPPGRP